MRVAVPPIAALIAVTLIVAALIAATVVTLTGMTVEATGFARFIVLGFAMLALSGWCRWRYPDKRLAHAAAIVGSGTLSLLICGVISNAGLALRAPLMDATLVAADAAVGLHVDQAVRAVAGYPRLIDALAVVYNASGAAVVGLIALALIARPPAKAWELCATVIVAMQVVAVVSIAMPAMGAMAHLGMEDLQGAGLPAGAGVYHLAAFSHFRDGAVVLRLSDLSGLVTFPSFHTVLALFATQALWDTRARWPGIAWSAAVIMSTIPIGGHYVTDLAAGFAVWAGAAALARRAVLSSPST